MIGVLNTRPQEQAASLSNSLRAAGYLPFEVPLVELVLNPEQLERLEVLALQANGFLLSSPTLISRIQLTGKSSLKACLLSKPWYLISQQAQTQVEAMGGKVAYTAKEPSLKGLLSELSQYKGLELLHLCSTETRLDPLVFAEHGIKVLNVPCYSPICPEQSPGALATNWNKLQAVLFASGSAVENLFKVAPELGQSLGTASGPIPFSIGPSATEALQRWGISPFYQSPTPDNAGFISGLNQIFKSPTHPEENR